MAKQTPQGRRRVKKKSTASPEQRADQARLRQVNMEIQGMVESGASRIRKKQLQDLQREATTLANRVRARRRAKKKSTR